MTGVVFPSPKFQSQYKISPIDWSVKLTVKGAEPEI